ncbi:MAG: DUF2118 domain-containing protein [Candidatus Baldrarchaeia archaeon]
MKIPQVFVEISSTEIEKYIESGKAQANMLLSFPDKKIEMWINKGDEIPDIKSAKVFVQKIYDAAYQEIFDLEKGEVEKDCIIIYPDRKTHIRLKKGDKIAIVEAKGYIVQPYADIGVRVFKDLQIAAIITKKGEIRYVRSPVRGVVVYVAELYQKPQTIIFFILPE